MSRGTRREFFAPLLTFGIAGVAVVWGSRVVSGQSGLDKFLLPAPPCKDDLTPAVPVGGYRPGAPLRKTLNETSVVGTRMTVTGYVTGLSCGRIKGARVDFWHADPGGRTDNVGFRFRGAIQTDADGRYAIETVVPGSEDGRARHIRVRVEPPGKKPFTTLVFFPNDMAATKDKQFHKNLVMKAVTGAMNSYTFDFLLDA